MRLILLGVFFFVALLLDAQSTTISYTIENATDSTYFLGYHMADQRFVQDTLAVDDKGTLLLDYPEGLKPGLYFVYSPGSGFYQEFFINEPAFEIATNGSYQGTTVSNSKENAVFKAFQLKAIAIQVQIHDLNDSLKLLAGDDSVQVIKSIRALNTELKDVRKELADENPDLLVSKMLRLLNPVELDNTVYEGLEKQEKSKRQYLDYRDAYKAKLDFEDPGLLRTPVFKSSVMRYVTEVIPQIPDSIIVELDKILIQTDRDPTAFRFWLVTLTDYYQNSKMMGMETVLVHLLDKYYLTEKVDWITNEARVKMEQELKYMKPNQIGRQAPPLILMDTAKSYQQPLTLSNEYLVLYFYDPDCSHCKKKTPLLKAAYPELKALGVEVVAANIADEVEKWKKYIHENNLDWVNLADPEFRSNFRAEYNIRSTPYVYVLDKDRKIIAKKIDVEQVVKFITNYKEAMAQ